MAVDIETAAQSPGTQFPGAQLPAVPSEGRRAITYLVIAVLVSLVFLVVDLFGLYQQG